MYNCCHSTLDTRTIERLVCEAKKAAAKASQAAKTAECAAATAREAACAAEAAAEKVTCLVEEYLSQNQGCGCPVHNNCCCD
ncbi:MAG: hypothetical protein E7403_05755 [Ruminococcaceae bacterium]|nr:hypothetical protein [Oscillospiraceae bacterium]